MGPTCNVKRLRISTMWRQKAIYVKIARYTTPMELSIFLAQLFGAYFTIAGALIIWRQKSFMPVVTEIGESRAIVIVVALVELMAGLAIAIAHPVFTYNWQGLVTAIGYWLILESIIYIALPHQKVRKMIRAFNKQHWYVTGGAISIAIGLYLASAGFGLA
jgi:hypothetical protein